MPSADLPPVPNRPSKMVGSTETGETEGRPAEPIPPILVFPDPPAPSRAVSRLLLGIGAGSFILLVGAAVLLVNQLDDGRALRRATAGELEASGQPEVEYGAPRPPPTSPSTSTSAAGPATAPRLRGGTERPAGAVDDLGLARRAVADQIRTFDVRLREFESGAASCQQLATAYRSLDRAFVRFSTLLTQASQPPRDTDGQLFEIVDEESAAFDRSGCPRPS